MTRATCLAFCLLLASVVVACTPGGATLAELGFTTALPGAEGFDVSLDRAIAAAWQTRPAGYEPRTRHLRRDGAPTYVNRLFLESSPYLQQHAHNPVNWYPWGDEAFELAARLGRPVLLSIGYSTCHWCHVMEEESFDDGEIARYLNEHYVAIKVDREVRPDLDSVYMSAVQLFTNGRGGWPMTLWLTPDRQPYSGGTYFPARDGDRGVGVGFYTLLQRLKTAYDEQPDRVTEVSSKVAEQIRSYLAPAAAGSAVEDDTPIRETVSFYRARFDETHGGLQGTQKFPASLSARLLLRAHRRTGDPTLLDMTTLTLERMAAGGMHDHVGGGFHRYSTDEAWLVPHFEKMLYDNALLALTYLETAQATGRAEFADVARDIFRYVERDMTSPEGGFYAAGDADSVGPDGEMGEGWFFTWTPDEIEAVLGPERSPAVLAYYGVTDEGNFDGRTVLHTPRAVDEVALELGLAADTVRASLEESRERLYAARAERPAPLRDEKILTAWNGLMISALARGAQTLGEPEYATRAARAASLVLDRIDADGRLPRDVAAADHQTGYLDDYAFFIGGLLDLFETTGETRWLEAALALDRILEDEFEDPEEGGYFMTAGADLGLLAREKPLYDDAEPSGNAVQLLNLVRLHEFTTDDRYRQRTARALGAFASVLTSSPAAAAEMLLAVDFHLDTVKEIILVTPSTRAEAAPFLERLAGTFLPNRILAVAVEGPDLETQAAVVPLMEGKYAIGGVATAYVCEHRICDLPTTDPEVFAEQIRQASAPAVTR